MVIVKLFFTVSLVGDDLKKDKYSCSETLLYRSLVGGNLVKDNYSKPFLTVFLSFW